MSNSIVNQTLTNYAQGLMADRAKMLTDFLAPTVPTGVAHGQYLEFNDKQAFQAYNTARATGGKRARILFDETARNYNAVPYALEIAIDDHERESAGVNDQGGLMLEQAKIQTLLVNIATSREVKTWNTIKGAVAPMAGLGVWTTPTVDPILEIDTAIEAIATATGIMPNRIAIGLGAWKVLKNHVLVRDRFPGSLSNPATVEQVKGLFLNPNITIEIGVTPYDVSKMGASKNNTNIVGNEVFVFYASDTPTVYDPSFAKTFRVSQTGIESVKVYRDESCASDIYAIDYSEEVKVTAASAGRRISVS